MSMWQVIWRVVKWTATLLAEMVVMMCKVVVVLVCAVVLVMAFLAHFVGGPRG
jgi:hypothetical protein